MTPQKDLAAQATELRSRAEVRLGKQRQNPRPKAESAKSAVDAQRLLHELQVHQVELEMQNGELQEARNRMESLLEKYTDLYDFAPVGYFSLDEQGRILEANLTGAVLLGMERSRLLSRRLPRLVVPASLPTFQAFLERVFAEPGKQECEAALLREGGSAFWASVQGTANLSLSSPRKWCRVAVSDITFLKQGQEAQRRMEALAVTNRELRQEIVRREAAEESLRKSEHHARELLEQSRRMQDHLRLLSRQLLSVQEEERKRISRELHDVIAQTLTGINIRLAALKTDATVNIKDLERKITRTQQLVEQSVDIVHRFARQLRPTVLDDLGLIPALHALLKHFRAETGTRVSLTAFAAVEQVTGDKRTVLYRVAQEALANVAQHAQATQVEVKLEKLKGALAMTIRDNGKGFQPQGGLRGKKKNRLGLLGMRERVEMVQGTFTIQSVPGQGTTVQAQLPLAPARRRARKHL